MTENQSKGIDPLVIGIITFWVVFLTLNFAAEVARKEVRRELERERMRHGRRIIDKIVTVLVNEKRDTPEEHPAAVITSEDA